MLTVGNQLMEFILTLPFSTLPIKGSQYHLTTMYVFKTLAMVMLAFTVMAISLHAPAPEISFEHP